MATESKKPAGPDLAEGIAAGDLAEGAMIAGHVGDDAVLVARVGGEVFAIGAKCTHYGGPLGKGVLAGDVVHCPWHHACFSLRTGEAVRAPAIDPVARWRTEIAGDRIVVREKLPKKAATRGALQAGARMVIVGGGAAGFAAAERLRREGFTGEVTILSADDTPPVDRPNLSKDYLAGKAPQDWVFLKPASFYADRGIGLELGAHVAALDPARREVSLADGRRFAFDKLLLATGAEPVRLPIPGAERAFTLRSLADSRAIIAAAAPGKTAVVIGSSFIGLEVAASLITRGLGVHVVSRSPLPLQHTLGEELGEFIRAEHEAHGVVFHLGRTPAAIEPRHVVLDDGARLAADLVVMGVGVRPRTELAAAGLRLDGGVSVDAYLETNAPGIFAAGDIARFPYPLAGGGDVRVEHWVLAERQGQTAALNMLGRRQRYAEPPFFWSQHYDVPINYVGHAGTWDAVEVGGEAKARDVLVRYKQGGRTVAVASIYRDQESLRAELELATTAA